VIRAETASINAATSADGSIRAARTVAGGPWSRPTVAVGARERLRNTDVGMVASTTTWPVPVSSSLGGPTMKALERAAPEAGSLQVREHQLRRLRSTPGTPAHLIPGAV
jgi:hypothetical protein